MPHVCYEIWRIKGRHGGVASSLLGGTQRYVGCHVTSKPIPV
jgi:hypothetical protein